MVDLDLVEVPKEVENRYCKREKEGGGILAMGKKASPRVTPTSQGAPSRAVQIMCF